MSTVFTHATFDHVYVDSRVQCLQICSLNLSQLPKNGRLILDWPRPQEITGNGWNASYRFHQPYLEKVLTEGVERFGNVTVMRGTKVIRTLLSKYMWSEVA